MSGYIGATSVSFEVTEADIKGDLKSTDDSPEVVLTNTTEEDTDGGRESKITFKGEQSGGEVSTLAQIQASHDGTADDEKGDLIFSTNDGSDGNTPTERMRIDSAGDVSIGTLATGITSSLMVKSNSSDFGILLEENSGAESWQFGVDVDGDLNFHNSGSATPSVTFDDSGNVGIGTASPSSILHLKGTNPDVYITSADTGQSDIYFGGETSPTKGRIQYTDNSDFMAFWADSVEVARLDPNEVKFKSTGDMDLIVSADTDNVTESDNPRIILQQDGSIDHLIIGVAGANNDGMTGVSNNGSYINAANGFQQLCLGTAGVAALKIDNDGHITLPKLPAFTVYNNAAIPYTTNGDKHITFNTARLNRGNHFSLTNEVFTVPTTGLYFFTATIAFHSQESTADDSQYITFRINGAELGRNAGSLGTMTNSRAHTSSGVELSQGISMILDLSTNDTVGLEYGDIQSDVTVSNAVFSGYMIG